MSAHISDDLPQLLTGDATREVVMAAAQHLRVCADCQQELVSAVVAHASLTSAHRFAPEIVTAGHDVAELHGVNDGTRGDAPRSLPELSSLPDLSALLAEARAESAAAPVHQLRVRRRLLAVAAAAAVIVGGGVTTAVLTSSDSGVTTRTVALTAFDRGQTPASVTIVGNSRLRVDASKLPKLDSKHLYEVWLTTSDRKGMQSVGFIGDDNTASLAVSPKWMSQYNAIEVSLQRSDDPEYSGVSVLRGSYG